MKLQPKKNENNHFLQIIQPTILKDLLYRLFLFCNWQEMIDNGKIANVRELANILNINESYVATMFPAKRQKRKRKNFWQSLI